MQLSRSQGDVLAKILACLVLASLVWSLIATIYLWGQPRLFRKMWPVMEANPIFWGLFVTGIAVAAYHKWRYPVRFTWLEWPVQMALVSFMLVGLFGTFVMFGGDLDDREFWNGYVEEATHFEEWTERVAYDCNCDKEGKNCSTCYRNEHHPERWLISCSTGDSFRISRRVYERYVGRFGGERHVNLTRINQVSSGDGDKNVATWDESPSSLVPMAVEKTFVNFLKASRSIRLRQGLTERHEELLLDYPRVYTHQFGPIEVDRVLNAGGVNVPEPWVQTVDQMLDDALAELGYKKQVNLLVYLVNSGDRGFLHALEEHWVYGKKNDVVLVLGATDFPRLDWAGVMIFAGNDVLKVELRDLLESELSDLSNAADLAQLFINQVVEHFDRVSMSELEYLLHDIQVPFGIYLLIFLQFAIVNIAVSMFMVHNNWRTDRH